jgi:hypothetical protein
MGSILSALFFVGLFVLAPFKFAAIFTCALLFSSLVIKATAASISHVEVPLTDAFKALVYSFFFSFLAILTIFSFLKGAPREVFMSPTSIVAIGWPLVFLQYGAYVLGFKIALGVTLLHSILVAAVSTAITSGSIWLIGAMVGLTS